VVIKADFAAFQKHGFYFLPYRTQPDSKILTDKGKNIKK
jgi:hypothetical protein